MPTVNLAILRLLVPHGEVGHLIVALYFSLSESTLLRLQACWRSYSHFVRYTLQQVLNKATFCNLLLGCIWVPCTFCEAEDTELILLYPKQNRMYFQFLQKSVHLLLMEVWIWYAQLWKEHGVMRLRPVLEISFYNKVTHLVDEEEVVKVIFMDFSKAFDTIFPCILLDKL